MMRLQKFLAHAGVGSLRTCEHYIAQGLVQVNGQTVTAMGVQIDLEKDEVSFRGRLVRGAEEKVTILLNKPEGYVTTSKDQFGRPSVLDLIDLPGVRLYPVGRLDYQTTGLLLLTNDGDLTYRLTHPRHHVAKTYEALLQGEVTGVEIRQLEKGVVLDDGYRTGPAKARLLSQKGRNSLVRLTIFEGKNHQVRRMAKAIHHPVLHLKRVQIADLTIGTLKEGAWRKLTEQEIQELKKACGSGRNGGQARK